MRNESKDPYDILGVSKTATQDEIKRAYRRLVKQHHPDHNAGDKAAEARFKEIQAAWEVLGDEQRRRQYDQFGAGGPTPEYRNWNAGPGFQEAGFDFNSMGDLSSIFEQFFSRGRARGGAAGRRRAPAAAQEPGGDIETELQIGFEEAARGTTREVELRGSSARPERIEVKIPAGVDDGQVIRVRGRGQPGHGGRGDLLIRCRVQPHAWYRRDGDDVLLDLPLSVAEAALGARVDIPTLDGPTLVTIPPGTSSGTRLRLRGKGIRGPRSEQPGDLYAVVKIHLPKNLGAGARAALEDSRDDWRIDARRELGWEK